MKTTVSRKSLPVRISVPGKSQSARSPRTAVAILALGICTPGLTVSTHAAIVSTWSFATSGSWEDGTKWSTNPVVPNNGNAGQDYDARINTAGTYAVTLSSDVTVNSVLLNSTNATLHHAGGTLQVNGALTLQAGTYSLEGGAIKGATITRTGGSLLFTNNGNNRLDGATLDGDLNLNQAGGAQVRLQNGAGFTGNANLGTPDGNVSRLSYEQTSTLSKTVHMDGTFGGAVVSVEGGSTPTVGTSGKIRGQGTISGPQIVGGPSGLINQGTISADISAASLTISGNLDSFTNAGTVKAVNGATLNVANGYIQTAGVTRVVVGGTSTTDPGKLILIQGGSLSGSGLIDSTVITSSTIAPGASAGTLFIGRDLVLSGAPILQIEIGGTAQGTEYDLLAEAGTIPLTLGGALEVRFINGFQSSILPTDSFTIVTSNQSILGTFSNVGGGRIATADGTGSFAFLVSGTDVILGGFVGVPEPGTGLLCLLGLPLLLGRRRRQG